MTEKEMRSVCPGEEEYRRCRKEVTELYYKLLFWLSWGAMVLVATFGLVALILGRINDVAPFYAYAQFGTAVFYAYATWKRYGIRNND